MSGWRPWYEEMAEMNSAQDRTDYLKGVFAPPQQGPGHYAGMAATAGLISWGVSQWRKARAERSANVTGGYPSEAGAEELSVEQWSELAMQVGKSLEGIHHSLMIARLTLVELEEDSTYRAHICERFSRIYEEESTALWAAVGSRDLDAINASYARLNPALEEMADLFDGE